MFSWVSSRVLTSAGSCFYFLYRRKREKGAPPIIVAILSADRTGGSLIAIDKGNAHFRPSVSSSVVLGLSFPFFRYSFPALLFHPCTNGGPAMRVADPWISEATTSALLR